VKKDANANTPQETVFNQIINGEIEVQTEL